MKLNYLNFLIFIQKYLINRGIKKIKNKTLFDNINKAIINHNFKFNGYFYDKYNFLGNKFYNDYIKQFIIYKILSHNFKRVSSVFIGLNLKIIYPMPYCVVKIIKKKIDINIFFSVLFFYFQILIFFFFFIFKFFLIFLKNFKKNQFHKLKYKNYIYLYNIKINNYKNFHKANYMNSILKSKKNIFHNIKFNFQNHKFFKINIFEEFIFEKKLFQFLYTAIISIIHFVFSYLFEKNFWLNILSLNDQLHLYFYKQNTNYLNHGVYYFDKDLNFRPLWSYYAEIIKKNDIFVNFYSINDKIGLLKNSHKNKKDLRNLYHNYEIRNWPIYNCWGTIHKKYLKKIKFSNVPVLKCNKKFYYSDENSSLETNLKKPYIASFIITPVKKYYYDSLFLPGKQVHNLSNTLHFIESLIKLSRLKKLNLVIKLKRNFSYFEDDNFIKKFNKMNLEGKFDSVNSSINIETFIKNSKVVITQPFTSVGIIANEMGKKSIFYDNIRNINYYEKITYYTNKTKYITRFNDLKNSI